MQLLQIGTCRMPGLFELKKVEVVAKTCVTLEESNVASVTVTAPGYTDLKHLGLTHRPLSNRLSKNFLTAVAFAKRCVSYNVFFLNCILVAEVAEAVRGSYVTYR